MKAGKTALTIDPRKARDAVKKHLMRLQNATNGVQFTAQLHEVEMTELLVEMARNPIMPPGLRRQCALDVLNYARGAPKVWLHDGETIEPGAPGGAGLGATISQEIDAAKQTARLHEQLALLTASNVHPSMWPPEVRAVAADMVAFYDAEEGIVDVKAS